MRLSLSLTVWLLSVSPVAAFTSPHVRARVTNSKLYADDTDAIVAAYGRKAIKATLPVDPPVVDAPPLAVPELPIQQSVKEAVISQKAAIIEKVSSPSGALTPSGKSPTLVEWIGSAGADYRAAVKSLDKSSLLASPIDAEKFDAGANLKEKLIIMKTNVLSGMALPESGEKVTVFDFSKAGLLPEKFAAGASAATAGVSTFFDYHVLADKLALKEYGVWYLVGATFIWGLLQRKSGRTEAEIEFTEKLGKLEGRATEAAEAATIAAKGASMAKKMVYRSDSTTNLDVLERTRLKSMAVDMENMKKNTDKLKTEASSLKESLKVAESKAASAEAQLSARKAAPAPKQAPKSKPAPVPAPPAPKPDSVPASPAPKPVPVSAPPAPKPVPVPAPPAPKPVPVPAPPAPKVNPVADPEPTSFAEVSEPPAPTPKGTKKVARKVAKKMMKKVKKVKKEGTAEATVEATATVPAEAPAEAPAVEPTPVVGNGENPWAELAPSALKRKTVKDLSEYLQERGVTVTGGDGKPLKKSLLISAVENL